MTGAATYILTAILAASSSDVGAQSNSAEPVLLAGHSCRGDQILSFALTSKHARFSARTHSGFSVVAVPLDSRRLASLSGWSVDVYSPMDASHTNDLLSPSGDWNGSIASRVRPETAPEFYPRTRVISVRSTNHAICLRLEKPKVVLDPPTSQMPLGTARFASGRLVVVWLENGGM